MYTLSASCKKGDSLYISRRDAITNVIRTPINVFGNERDEITHGGGQKP